MEVFKNYYVKVKGGKIGKVKEVINVKYWNDKEVVNSTQEIYTDLRKTPYTLEDIEECSRYKKDLTKKEID